MKRRDSTSDDLESSPDLSRFRSYQNSPGGGTRLFRSIWQELNNQSPNDTSNFRNPCLLALCIVSACILMVLFCYEFGESFDVQQSLLPTASETPRHSNSQLSWYPPSKFRMEYDFIISDETGAAVRGHSIFHYDYTDSDDYPKFRGDEVYVRNFFCILSHDSNFFRTFSGRQHNFANSRNSSLWWRNSTLQFRSWLQGLHSSSHLVMALFWECCLFRHEPYRLAT